MSDHVFFAAFFLEAEQKPFPGRITIFDVEVYGGADRGERVGKSPEQRAVTQAHMRGRLDRVKKRLDFTFGRCRCLAHCRLCTSTRGTD